METLTGPQPLDNGYTIDWNDTTVWNWTVDIEGRTYTVADLTQTTVYEWAVVQVADLYRRRYDSNFESARIEYAEWRDGVIHGTIQTSWWRDENDDSGMQYLADRMVYFTAVPVLASE